MVRQLAAKAAAFNKPNYFAGGGMRKGRIHKTIRSKNAH